MVILPANTKLRSSKYLNNLIEQDHRGVKQRISVMLGFKGFNSAAITIAGIVFVRFLDPQPSLSLGGGNRPSCPYEALFDNGLMGRVG